MAKKKSEEKVVKKPKKRGRRPKNNITVNENPVFTNETDNLIISLQKKIETAVEDDIPGYETNDQQCEFNVEDQNDGVNVNVKDTNIPEDSLTCMCWNCCSPISPNIPVHIPHKYVDETFYTYGDFCSYECAARYIFDNCSGQEIWDKYILLNHHYNICHNTLNEKVKLAPNRLQLQHFGGKMTLSEYLENSTRDYEPVHIPPTIPVNHSNHQYDIKVKSTDKSELKLYRKKPVSGSNNIYDKMKIQTTKEN